MIERIRRFLRTWLPADITLLGWPGRRFWYAHVRHLVSYGRTVYIRDREYASSRHAQWVKEAYTLTFRRNWKGKLYIHAEKPAARKS